MNQVRRAVWSVDANLPLASAYTLNYFYQIHGPHFVHSGDAWHRWSHGPALGHVGLYGVIAYWV